MKYLPPFFAAVCACLFVVALVKHDTAEQALYIAFMILWHVHALCEEARADRRALMALLDQLAKHQDSGTK
jgi:hypothetical protein